MEMGWGWGCSLWGWVEDGSQVQGDRMENGTEKIYWVWGGNVADFDYCVTL